MSPEARSLRSIDEVQQLIATIPYARLLGFSVEADADGGLLGRMAFSQMRYGNARFKALHGGALAGLLEFAALAELLRQPRVQPVPARLSISVDYLRAAHDRDTVASASLIRIGRRIAGVRAVAWQADPAKPVVAATVQFQLEV